MRFPFISRLFSSDQAPRQRSTPLRTALRFEQLEDRRMLATIPVSLATDAANPTDQDGGITLREAISYVNTREVPAGDQGFIDFNEPFGTNDTIIFDYLVFGDGPGLTDTITLTAGEIGITEKVTIDATALTSGLTIDASGNDNDVNVDDGGGSRIFNIDITATGSDSEVAFRGLTFSGGDAFFDGGAIHFNEASSSTANAVLTIEESVFLNNPTSSFALVA